MHKRALVCFCMLALILGAFSVTAATKDQQTDDAFCAGYALVDINPKWSVLTAAGGEIPYSKYTEENVMPLPMDGYGDSIKRLAEPELTDDNGDGEVGAGDGLQATCVALRKGDKTLLLLSVDMLRVDDTWGKETRQLVSEATGVPVEQIMISASHTHGGVDMDMNFANILEKTYTVTGSGDCYTGQQISDYRTVYVDYVKQQLLAAAQSAMENAVAVTARKGTIEAHIQSGKNMNSVRHYQQWYNTKDPSFDSGYRSTKFVRGSNFNNDIDGNGSSDPYQDYLNGSWRGDQYKSSTVSATNDSLQLLEFIPQNGGESIVLVNWQAHPHTGTKPENHHLSSDFVGSMRNALKDAGYQSAFFQGAAGNLDNYNSSRETRAWFRENTTTYAQRSVNYGKKLAEVALALLRNEGIVAGALTAPMTPVATGEIRTKQLMFKVSGNRATYVENAAATAHIANTGCSRSSGQYPCAHTVKDQAGNETTYVIASAYHANNIVTRYKYSGNWYINGKNGGVELNVLTVGSELAFVTAPFELFDRYSMDVTLATANTDNDWQDLTHFGFGMPFVLSCTNEYWGYIANHLAYNYHENYLHDGIFAEGCYESQISYASDGSGEQMIKLYAETLEELSRPTRDCPACGETNAQWQKLTADRLESAGGTLGEGHYYLPEDVAYDRQVTLGDGKVCLDLQGHTYGSGPFAVSQGAALYVLDSATDDYDVADGNYGAVPAGDGVQAASGYLAVTEDGKTSFHKYEMALTELVINPARRGITYRSSFRGDQLVKAQVKEFGIALRIQKTPDETSISDDTECRTHVALPKEKWQTGNADASVKSVYITNIVMPGLGSQTNQKRAQLEIYGSSYIRLQDGAMLLSPAESFSMQSAVEHVDLHWSSLEQDQKNRMLAFYLAEEYHSFMQAWHLPNMKADAYKTK